MIIIYIHFNFKYKNKTTTEQEGIDHAAQWMSHLLTQTMPPIGGWLLGDWRGHMMWNDHAVTSIQVLGIKVENKVLLPGDPNDTLPLSLSSTSLVWNICLSQS